MMTNSKKFLLISPDFPPPLVGGSLVYLYTLLAYCPENFDVLTGPKDDRYSEVFQMPNRVYRSTFIKDSHDPSTWQLFLTYCYMPLWMILKNFKENYSAVLVNPGSLGNSILFLTGKIFGIKVIGIGHAEEITIPLYGKGIKNWLKRSLMQRAYKRASGFVVVCHFCRRLLISMNVDETFIDVIPSCLNPEKIGTTQSVGINNHRIASVGRLIERKGFHFLIDAVLRLKEEMPDIRLDIVGDGPFKRSLEDKISLTNSSPFIKLHGQISDVKLNEVYQNSSLFVLANTMLEDGNTEGCPSVFSEAMGHGLPLIGGLGAGVDTAITHGENGYLVDSQNIDKLSDSIRKILTNPNISKSMVEFGRKKLETDHNPEKAGLALQKTMLRIIEGRQAEGSQKELNLKPEAPLDAR